MKFLFIIQGEGRGHMTQSIALQTLLQQQGHEVAAALIGRSQRRILPEFVHKNLTCPIYQFDSPNFVTDPKEKSVRIGATLTHNFTKLGKYQKSLALIHTVVLQHQPDIIVNFYDILAGIYKAVFRPKASFWAIGHQYLIYHPDFPFAPGNRLQRWLFRWNTHLTAMGAQRLLALSFRELPAHRHPKLTVLPPLLRQEIYKLKPCKSDFILAYMVNSGYAEELTEHARKHPKIKIEAFWDCKQRDIPFQALPNLTFHPIDDQLFLEKMAQCRALLTTAGFESICEAMYLRKKVMMVPVAGQYEQACNAQDAIKAGAGVSGNVFNIQKLDAYLKKETAGTDPDFHHWLSQMDQKISHLLKESKNEDFAQLHRVSPSFLEQTLSTK